MKLIKSLLLKVGFTNYQLFALKQLVNKIFTSKNEEIKSYNQEVKTIMIAGRNFDLDMAWPHEKEYYNNHIDGIKDVDLLIAEELLKPEDIVLDVGANIGITGLHYLQLNAAEVHAFEPVPDIYNRLATLKGDKFYTYPFALSNKTGTESIFISKSHNQGNTLSREVIETYPSVFGSKLNQKLIDITTLDAILPNKKFDFIKVDIENHETQFIEGARCLLTENPPRILQIEIYDKTFDSTHSILLKYFNFARKVIYNTKLEKVEFVSIDNDYQKYLDKGFKIDPPNYIYYSNESLI